MEETGTADAGKEDGWLARELRAEIPPGLLRWCLVPVVVVVGLWCGIIIGTMTLIGTRYPVTIVAGVFMEEDTAGACGLAAGIIVAAVTGLWTWVGLVVLFTAPKYKRIVNAVFCAAVAGCIIVAIWTNPAPKPGTGSGAGLLPSSAPLLVVALVFVGMNAWLRHAARKGLPSPLKLLTPKTARMKDPPPLPGGESGEESP
ncbi:MAG: hypothetical protein GXY15_01210 [Candidatus Hydrogenedentes bacterium]|nr:hypothetical protein [Candidatus Hydrogenedentota bacterium]